MPIIDIVRWIRVDRGGSSRPSPTSSGTPSSTASPPSQAREDSVELCSTGSRAEPDDAVEHGEEAVTVTFGETEDGFYVADDGRGIPGEERERVFEPDYSTAADGTGFGLSIVRQVVEQHGGAVRIVESDTGGAHFEVTGVEFVD